MDALARVPQGKNAEASGAIAETPTIACLLSIFGCAERLFNVSVRVTGRDLRRT